MVLNFFRGADDGLTQIDSQVAVMLASCRHSYDLAMGALVTDGDIAPVAKEVRDTDQTINGIEEEVRRELIVHTAVTGGVDVGAVLALLLIVKKLERVGDQAKNILNLAEEGVRMGDADDYDRFVAYRTRMSTLFADAQRLLAQHEPVLDDFIREGTALMDECETIVLGLLHDDSPASYAVPRAMLFRYLKRTAANVLGTVVTTAEGVDRIGDQDLDE